MNIGVDLSKQSEFEDILKREKYKRALFTEKELAIASNMQVSKQLEFFTGRFCTKEAVAKALETGLLREFNWKDIEVVKGNLGEPKIKLYRRAYEILLEKGYSNIKGSISHKDDLLISTVIIY